MIRHPLVTGVVLAGGRAVRMGGQDKSSLPLSRDPSDTPLSRILRCFEGRFPECLLVTAPERASDEPLSAGIPVRRVTDLRSGCGPLAGIEAGLAALATPWAFVCGADMPTLSGELIDLLILRARPGRLLVPVRRGRPEPLHSLYPAACLTGVRRALDDGIRMLLDLFERLDVDYLHEEEYGHAAGAEDSFANINTPEDLELARRP